MHARSVVISGGDVDNGANAGPFARDCADGAGYSYWGVSGRPLCYTYLNLTFSN